MHSNVFIREHNHREEVIQFVGPEHSHSQEVIPIQFGVPGASTLVLPNDHYQCIKNLNELCSPRTTLTETYIFTLDAAAEETFASDVKAAYSKLSAGVVCSPIITDIKVLVSNRRSLEQSTSSDVKVKIVASVSAYLPINNIFSIFSIYSFKKELKAQSGEAIIIVIPVLFSESPSRIPSVAPSDIPTKMPSFQPTISANPSLSVNPSLEPSVLPSLKPSQTPSDVPSLDPSKTPSGVPSISPTTSPKPSDSRRIISPAT